MKFGRNKSESDDGSTPPTKPKAAGVPPTPPPINREPRESIAPRESAAPRGEARPAAPATSSGPTSPASTGPGPGPGPEKTSPKQTGPEKSGPEKTDPEKSGPATDEQTRRHSGLTDKNKVRGTRVSGLWIGVVIAAILAVFLLIFIAQNSDDVTIKFLGWEGNVPLAVAMLAGAVISVLIVAIPGSLRIAQLRRALRKNAAREGKTAH